MNILKKLTANYLKLNKKRTLVTIIGIILSGAMISAVTTLAVSFQAFMIDYEIETGGAWEAKFKEIPYSELKYFENNNQIKDSFIESNLYMAENKYSTENYLRIDGYEEDAILKMGEKLLKGELPKNSDEIALSNTFFDGKDNEPQIGDTITFNVGYVIDVEPTENNPDGIQFVQTGTKTYKITGMIQRPTFESSADYYTAGITILDKEQLNDNSLVNVGIIMKDAKEIYKITEELADHFGLYYTLGSEEKIYEVQYNTSLLAYMGVNNEEGFNAMIYSVCGVLILVIMIGSIMVIYNSFAISISERKKQFGMLSSVGATKSQIRKSVIYEGAILGLIGIPIGIACGILGIGITLNIVNELLEPIFEVKTFDLELVVSWEAIAIAVILIAITIYMSVVIPARRASKITPIEAIRQIDDVKVKPKKLKTPKFIYKLFGMEGTIALKNLKRAKKRYRTTVISLVISVILYISVSGFVGYLGSGFDSVYKTYDYDFNVSIYARNENLNDTINLASDELLKMDNVERISKIHTLYREFEIPANKLDNNIKKIIEEDEYMKESQYNKDTDSYQIVAQIICLNEEEYSRYLNEIGIKNISEDEVVLINTINLIMDYGIETNITKFKNGDEIKLEDENQNTSNLKIAKLTDKEPLGIDAGSYGITLFGIVSKSGFDKLKKNTDALYTRMYIQAEDINAVDEQIDAIQEKYTNLEIYKSNVTQNMIQEKNLKLIIQIFLYGFIALISAIGISNIFNTISTNINLRRREFANLKSIGMTDKQFRQNAKFRMYILWDKSTIIWSSNRRNYMLINK